MYDIEQIKRQFSEVIRYSQYISDPCIDELFSQWETSKKKFIERFGGLIYEWPQPVEFVLDPKEKKQKAIARFAMRQRPVKNESKVFLIQTAIQN